jgi:hypothetical protein
MVSNIETQIFKIKYDSLILKQLDNNSNNAII